LEASLKGIPAGAIFQFERLGYFCADLDSSPERLVFNRAVALRDEWTKIEMKGKNSKVGDLK
jgi:glutaminyl-tRNA synthetase